ncbi:MAG: hypothetical protein HFG47_07270 [Lachnospiraceae bacterium]|nr:hypothetical protein [Lachnospiraceae bacterium]
MVRPKQAPLALWTAVGDFQWIFARNGEGTEQLQLIFDVLFLKGGSIEGTKTHTHFPVHDCEE